MSDLTRKSFVFNEAAFNDCVDDVTVAVREVPAVVLPDSSRFEIQVLREALRNARKNTAPIYQENLVDWFLGWLGNAQNHYEDAAAEFRRLRKKRDDKQELTVKEKDVFFRLRHVFDTCNGILQKGDPEYPARAFQEVVADLYDGFCSAQDRKGATPPEGVLPAFVSWRQHGAADAVSRGKKFEDCEDLVAQLGEFNLPCGHIRMPATFARGGLLAWSVLGHETLGHDMTAGYPSFHDELIERATLYLKSPGNPKVPKEVAEALDGVSLPGWIHQFWTERIEETASDVLGILNMGPAAALGMLGYFRGSNGADDEGAPKLSREQASGRHPPDVVRGYLWEATVNLLSTSRKGAWADAIRRLTEADAETGVFKVSIEPNVGEKLELSINAARASAKVVAMAVAASGEKTVGRPLSQIQNWSDTDEQIVGYVWEHLVDGKKVQPWARSGVYAAHVVACTIEAAFMRKGGTSRDLLQRMTALLETMYRADETWGPLSSGFPSASGQQE